MPSAWRCFRGCFSTALYSRTWIPLVGGRECAEAGYTFGGLGHSQHHRLSACTDKVSRFQTPMRRIVECSEERHLGSVADDNCPPQELVIQMVVELSLWLMKLWFVYPYKPWSGWLLGCCMQQKARKCDGRANFTGNPAVSLTFRKSNCHCGAHPSNHPVWSYPRSIPGMLSIYRGN